MSGTVVAVVRLVLMIDTFRKRLDKFMERGDWWQMNRWIGSSSAVLMDHILVGLSFEPFGHTALFFLHCL